MQLQKLLLIGIIGLGACCAGADRLPEFSWDTVPRYMHVRKVTAFTPEETAYLAAFPLITFEKTTGMKEFGSTEQGTLQAAEAVKHILEVYAKNANKYERLGEWAERIGWEKFFELTEIPFTIKSIDDYRLAYDTWRTTTQFKFTSHIK